ncbi:MAG: EutN/CcmL family microcompartment protein [Calditrichaceae bacterium]|nr:EutN/CcmL family microcompartment protein [Calditrichaceae bacterium]MBN2710358.1 EutN/CcmL family microcompartment protein [Calditrichaceae bacterium]RQV95107.1 MAG: ethanolamine utilization protein EutN [Calditrichota bacterium]
MKLGRVIGKVWATVKDPKLTGVTLYLMQPVNELDEPLGRPAVAADVVGSREGDLIYWVGSAEATFVLEDRQIPSDVSIVGIVDDKSTGGD